LSRALYPSAHARAPIARARGPSARVATPSSARAMSTAMRATAAPTRGGAGSRIRGPSRRRRIETRRTPSHRAHATVCASASATVARETQRAAFDSALSLGNNVVPLYRRIFDDQLTPILAYRLLVKEDEREAPSFLLESVVGGTQIGRYSFLGRRPVMEVTAKDYEVTVTRHEGGGGGERDDDGAGSDGGDEANRGELASV